MFFGEKKIYMDYAAATPVLPEVRRAMEPYWQKNFYNPSAIYDEAREVRKVVEQCRAQVAKLVGAGTKDVIFTSGGTESINLAVLGAFEAVREEIAKPHLVVGQSEHTAVLEASREVGRRGGRVSFVPESEVLKSIKPNTFLVSASIPPKLSRLVREVRRKRNSMYPLLHRDASQKVLYADVSVEKWPADLLTLDGSKIYGPKGIGVLVARPRARIHPIIFGGGQERGLRAGTESVPLIIGFTHALTIVCRERIKETKRVQALREMFISGVGAIESIEIGGEDNIVTISIPGVLPELLVLALEREGVLVSSGTACSSIGESESERVRFSFGRDTTERDVKQALKAFRQVCSMLNPVRWRKTIS